MTWVVHVRGVLNFVEVIERHENKYILQGSMAVYITKTCQHNYTLENPDEPGHSLCAERRLRSACGSDQSSHGTL